MTNTLTNTQTRLYISQPSAGSKKRVLYSRVQLMSTFVRGHSFISHLSLCLICVCLSLTLCETAGRLFLFVFVYKRAQGQVKFVKQV